MPRVLVRDGDRTYDVFEVVSITDELVTVRSPLLFEIGEELQLDITDRTPSNVTARVLAHVGTGEARVTDLELLPAD